MLRLHLRIVPAGIALSLTFAGLSGSTFAQSVGGAPSARCTLVTARDFSTAHLPRPDQLVAVTPAPQEQCHAVYGTGQEAAVIAIQYGPPFQGMPFKQNLQLCRRVNPPCELVQGVGEQAYYQRSGRPIGYGSIQEVLASLHRRVLSVKAVGMTVPVAKRDLLTLAREAALRAR